MQPSRSKQLVPLAAPPNTLPVQVVRREIITKGVVSLFLAQPGSYRAPAAYVPGQFVTLALPTSQSIIYRSYSLCSDGRTDQPWEITIKRQGAISSYLYDAVGVNALLYATTPRGSFILPTPIPVNRSVIFVAAGSGITPIMGMLRLIAKQPAGQRPQVQLHYASRTLDDIIYRAELDRMDPQRTWLRQWHYFSAMGQRLTAEAVVQRAGTATTRALWYMCGPQTLHTDIQGRLARLGVPSAQVHAEVFATSGATTKSAAVGPIAARIRVQATGATLEARRGETVLNALERQGYRPDFSCRVGACGTCKLRLVAGRVAPVGDSLTPAERNAGYVLSCVAVPQGDIALQDGGRPPTSGAARGGISPATARSASKSLVRLASIAAFGVVLLGTWPLTNHRPLSWGDPPAAVPTQPTSGGNSGGTLPHPTATPTRHKATPTPDPAGGYPTPTPIADQPATPTPEPQPTATPQPPPPPVPTVSSGSSH